ncbi:MAG: FAD-dependent oxidoreductase, partial [Rhodospirillales bacterium]|nr:FAD-dependent oxidoreductase [Rhodospirillales bacterium]
AEFYYKTFMGLPPFEWGRGTGAWMQYEKLIRKSAGMGRAARVADPDHYEHSHGYCDLLVVGAGIAGISAAIAAGQAGLDVVLVEQDFLLGGDLLHQPQQDVGSKRQALLMDLSSANVRVMDRTTAFGMYDHGVVGLLERVSDHHSNASEHQPRQRMWTMRAERTVLATGALERHIAFDNNDRPGVMSASAARAYIHRYAVLPAKTAVVATNNDTAYQVAMDMADAGAHVTLLDTRSQPPEEMAQQALSLGVEVKPGMAPVNVKGARGVAGLELVQRDGPGWIKSGSLPCDGLFVSGGWSPVVNLHSHQGVKPVWSLNDQCFLPGHKDGTAIVAGSAAGHWCLEDCETSGLAAGEAIAVSLGKRKVARQAIERRSTDTPIDPVYEINPEQKSRKCFVDPQHDVTTSDVRLAHQEGFVSVEHLKRYTTLGMATDQGKMGNIIGLALMADALGKEIPDVGTTTFRPPYTPVSLGAFTGPAVDEHFKPLRRTPMHDWNIAQGATMTDAGLWHRTWYFARQGETINEAYAREAETVRKTVGICDVTTLGKIAVQGPDATEFLNRVYTNPFAKLAIGKARYGIMLRDDAYVMDDGTTWRLSETDYFMTTTTTNAGKVMTWLEELLQVRWSDLRVHVTSVSEQWAGFAIAGPLARETLQACLVDPQAVSDEACPFMGVIDTALESGVPCRIARISFSGEMAYEIYVPSDFGVHLADQLWSSAQARDGCQYGLEALGALRIEKGHVTGAELDGRVTIDDAGLGSMASKTKHYIGSVLNNRPELLRDDRAQLVGIFPKDRTALFNAGSLLCAEHEVSGYGEGWVTGVTYSPALGHWIGIGFISGGYTNWKDKSVIAADPVRNQTNVTVEIVSPHMFDAEGGRMRG